jgi:serine/threonine protein kinase
MTYRRLKEGDRVGEYTLTRLTLRSDTGEVWVARHHLLDRRVSVRVAVEERELADLREMGVVQHTLDHPAVVKTLGLNLDKNPPFLVIEHCSGRTLREVMAQDAPVSWERALSIAIPILEGLVHAHGKGFVHGDLRPENIFVDDDGRPRMTGFGRRSARQTADDLLSDSLGDEEREAVREAAYLPGDPDPPSPSFDVYSVGVILFELLTGGLPAGSELPSDVVEGLPDAADKAFRGAYTNINLRYKDAEAMLGDLEAVRPRRPSGPAADGARGITFLRSSRLCPKCAVENPMKFRFCTGCGSQLSESEPTRCRICAKSLLSGAKFCTFCGAKQ